MTKVVLNNMFGVLKRWLIGKPLQSKSINDEKYFIRTGLPILSSDAISSVSYATEEILLVLVPAIGVMAFRSMFLVSIFIIALLFLLVFSYKQTIEHYPNGGGAYIVAKENLGVIEGVTAGASLLLDYILTVAVSISAGTAAISSAFPALAKYNVTIAIILLIIMTIINLRGVTESAKIFAIPPYAFILGILIMILVGLYRYFTGDVVLDTNIESVKGTYEGLYMVLICKAFSSGCSALTGVEAVSNAVPNFREPAVKHAKITLMLLALIVLTLFLGISTLDIIYKIVPKDGVTVLSLIANAVFGKGFMFYYIQVTTMLILVLAANTAFSGFPLLLNVISRDGFSPRQFSFRGDRLSYSNGIIALSIISGILIVIFKGSTHRLIPLYSVGVFISFTLSQFGMFKKWFKDKEKGYKHKCIINGFGALVTALTAVIIAINKFNHGAWIVIIVIPLLVMAMLKIKRHYDGIADELRISDEEIKAINFERDKYRNKVIVPISSINVATIRALRYAKTISDNVTAFYVGIDEVAIEKIKKKWELLNEDIKLEIRYSPYRKIIEPLIEFIDENQKNYKKGDMVTLVLSHFSVRTWWHIFLHNQTKIFIEKGLLRRNHIAITTVPFKLEI